MDNIRIFALGGLDENGKNMYVVEINNDIFLFETGLKYPETVQHGVEVIIPDFKYLLENKDKIKGLFITHAHDDTMGAISYLLKQINVPIYTTPLTAILVESLLKKNGVNKAKIHRIKRSSTFKIGNTQVISFGMTHSIMDAFGVALDTSAGYVVYTGEYIVDFDIKNDAFACDITELATIGKKGVFALLTESSGVDHVGYTAPNHQISSLIEEHFEDAKGRIIVTAYEQNLYRLIEIIEMANKFNRKILFYDDGVREILKSVESLKYYHIPAGLELSKEKFSNDLEDVLILVTGSGQKVFKKMLKIALGEDELIKMRVSDTVIIASPVVPGTEKEAGTMENELYKDDVKVVSLNKKKVYSMHASSEDIKMMLYLFKPKYFIPIHGEYRQLVSNANIALDTGMYADRIVVLDNGQIASFEKNRLKSTSDLLDLEEVMIDGNENLDVSGFVLKDRETLSTDGAIIVGVVVNFKTKQIIGGPDVQSRGLIYLKDADYIIKGIGSIMEAAIEDAVRENRYENMAVRLEAKDRMTKYVMKETGKRPMILPAIVEINISE